MESIPLKPLRAACHCSLALLTCLFGAAMLVRCCCHRSDFPVPGWRLRKRSGTSSLSTKFLPALRPRDANRRATLANISCTAHRTRSFGQAGTYNPRRAPFAARAGSSGVSHCQTDI